MDLENQKERDYLISDINELDYRIKELEYKLKKDDSLLIEEAEELEKSKELKKSLERRFYVLETDEKLNNDFENIDNEIKDKYNFLKKQNLKLVSFYKYFNKVKEIENEKTKNDKSKKAYKKLEKTKATDKPIKKVSAKKIASVEMCNCRFTTLTDIKFQKSKIVKTIKCKDKFCSICQKIKSTKDKIAIQTIYNFVKDTTNYSYLFLTLTAPNVKGEKLKKELEDYTKSFERLFKLKRIKKINKGYIAKLEITYNVEMDTYHPHYHVLIAVPKNYFETTAYYIKHSDWLTMWRKAKRDESITQVNVKKVKNKNDNGINSEVLELSKYIAKDCDYLLSLDTFEVFYNETYRRRFYKYGGIFKDAVKKFKNGELEKYIQSDEILWEFIINYTYFAEEETYKKYNLRKLTEQEKNEIMMNEIKNLYLEFEEI